MSEMEIAPSPTAEATRFTCSSEHPARRRLPEGSFRECKGGARAGPRQRPRCTVQVAAGEDDTKKFLKYPLQVSTTSNAVSSWVSELFCDAVSTREGDFVREKAEVNRLRL